MTNDTPTLAMLAAVNGAILAVKQRHEGIPDVVVVLGASAPKKHGHFHANTWVTRFTTTTEGTVPEDSPIKEFAGKKAVAVSTEDVRVHELFLSGESLSRGAVPTLGTIIHELAHAYAKANDIQDTSNRGRYHNKRFKEVAERMGITLEQAPTIGWSVTTVPDETAALYSEQVEALDAALTAYRVGSLALTGKVKKPTVKRLLGCPFCAEWEPVSVSKKVAEVVATVGLKCGSCDEPLEITEEG